MISPTLLEVQRDDTTLRLRVDDLTLEEETLTSDTITLWTLFECDNVERAFALFTDAIGKPVYIGVSPEEIGNMVAVWVNYAQDEETFTCASVHTVNATASFADLQQRVVRLATLYRTRDQEYEAFYRHISQATHRLQNEIEKARDRCDRKANFFHDTRRDKMAIYAAQRDTYTRILQLFHTIIDDAYRGESKNDTPFGTV